jgi:superfamily II DNA or RNA helicase
MTETRRVNLVNDPTKIGLLTGRENLRRGRKMLQVEFPDGVRWVPENQLEPVGEIRMSPIDMLETGNLGRPVDLRRTLTHMKLSGRLADVIYSMEATNTDFYAYQFKPVVKILESPANAILIADEVGLGKTIEAGLIWTELRSRFDMRRLLVLCPAALREKWRRELSTKIGVTAQICDAHELLDVLRDEDAQAKGFALVASTQGLRPPKKWEDQENLRASAKLARFLRSKESEERLVDLLVIDEAHHLRNPETRTNDLGQLCKRVAEYAVLLTATPIHNRNEDLYSLLHLLDPDTFTRPDVFRRILEANQPLVQARDLILSGAVDLEELQALLHEARNHELLRTNRQLTAILDQRLDAKALKNPEVRSRLAYRLETVNLLAHVVTRTRKRDVKEWRVLREPIPEFVRLAPVEERFYGLVTELVAEYAARRDVNEHFLLAQPQRQMTSSMAASLRAWQQKLVEVEEAEETGEVDLDNNRREALGPLVSEIISRSKKFVDLDELYSVDTKFQRLRTILIRFLSDHPQEKVIVFSTFRSTLHYLAQRLDREGVSSILLMGGLRETKDEIIARFRQQHGPSVLLSSEVGGEGVDLQFARVMVNYDVPWNPMRLEQRIGRIDRLGQEAEKVLIWNILFAETIDARIYNRLYAKLDLCRTALGDFEAILGESVRKLELELLAGRLTPEQQEQRIDQTAQALENLRLEEQRLELDAASLIAYGDYILNQVQAARELHRWISGEDIRGYVFDHLRLHYPGCELRQTDPDSDSFFVELSDIAKYDLTEFIKSHRLPADTRLTASSHRPVICRFSNRNHTTGHRGEETISQFHPLVRMVNQRIANSNDQLTPAVALNLPLESTQEMVAPGIYILAVAQWSFHGLQDMEKLSYAAAPLVISPEMLDSETSERLAGFAVIDGQDWIEARNALDLDLAYQLANDLLFAHLDEAYELFERELRAKNEDRADIQMQTLNEHLVRQTNQLEDILHKHRSMNRETLVKATEGRIRALQHRVQLQRLKIENRRTVSSTSREIGLALIRIE